MIHLSLIGIGAGNPQHVTLQAQEAIRACDVIVIPRKGRGKDDLASLRDRISTTAGAQRIVHFDLPVRDAANPSYRDGVDDWHDAVAAAWWTALSAALPGGGRAGFLIWGDPSLYDSSLRIAERLGDRVDVSVVPGITAIQSLTATHAIALNDIGAPVVITTGRHLRDNGWPEAADTVVVMLDSGGAFQAIDPEGVSIWWTAYAGMAEEISISGALSDVAEQIIETRAKARADHGWIMDVYLMRRSAKGLLPRG